jgi:PKD repeat protein
LGEITQFTNTSTGTALTYSWNFGDGSPVSSQVHPAHLYTAAGSYTVTLTATNPVGTDVTTGIVEIIPHHQFFLPLILTTDD